MVKSGSRFPVLIYHHGGSWTRFSGTFTTEWLASYGYVVVGVDHNGFNKSVLSSDGDRFIQDTLKMPTPGNQDRLADVLASWDYLGHQLFPIWVDDAAFVLDQVERLDREPGGRFEGRLDLSRIGMLGWSFGGATSVEMAIRDPRVKAAVDQDGQLFGRAQTTGSSKPVLLLHNTSDPVADAKEADRPVFRKLVDMTRAWTKDFVARSTGPVYEVSIEKTTHGHFSDLTLFFPRDSTRLDPRRAHTIINAYTLDFFEHHLKGRPSELLAGPSPRFSEVILSGNPASRR
jgi:predicted dienelactone hydrolase